MLAILRFLLYYFVKTIGLKYIYIYICIYAEKFYAEILNCLLGVWREGGKICLQVRLVVSLWLLQPLNLWQTSGRERKEVESEFEKADQHPPCLQGWFPKLRQKMLVCTEIRRM